MISFKQPYRYLVPLAALFLLSVFVIFAGSDLRAANQSEIEQWQQVLESAQKDQLCEDGRYFKSLKNQNQNQKRNTRERRYRNHTLRWLAEDTAGQVVDVHTDMPVRLDPSVSKWLDYFTGGGREHMLKWLVRAARVQPVIEAELAKHGMPKDMFYLAMIESGLSFKARSRAKAKGLWQFMLPTARAFGLRVDSWTDERRSLVASTEAASKYLKKLYRRFGSWHLAMAAYNAGPGKVRRAIRLSGTRDFFKLRRYRYLRRETKDYVPKFMAALLIGKNPERYGFSVERKIGSKVATKKIRLKNAYMVKDLARYYGVSVGEFKVWNPHLLRSKTPPISRKAKPFYIYVAKRFPSPAAFSSSLADNPGNTKRNHKKNSRSQKKAAAFKRLKTYRVQSGDTFSAISRRYGTSVAELRRLNPALRARFLRPGKHIKVRM
jgi:membrane-bound lytic murein transglycosylase D